MKQRIFWSMGMVVLLGLISYLGWALEVRRDVEHYLIAPKTLQDFSQETREKGPYSERLGHRVRAMYRSKAKFLSRLTYYRKGERCRIEFKELILEGTVVLYKLDPQQSYNQTIRERYKKRYEKSRAHELNHERIYKEGLERAEKRVRDYIQYNQANCATMRAEIRRIYQAESDNIELENLRFDCNAYGFKQELQRCRRLQRDEVTSVESAEQQACSGELIEAFPGKFYCVTGDYRR